MARAILYGLAIAVALAVSAGVARHLTQARPVRCPCPSPSCCSTKCAGCCYPLPCVLGGEVTLCRHARRP